MQPLADIEIIDDPYTMHLITEDSFVLAPPLAALEEDAKLHLARLAEGVVESILNWPEDVNGFRHIARARYRETVRLDRERAAWRLSRTPATIVSASLDGAALDLDDLRVQAATGVLRRADACWPSQGDLVVEYDAGWRTPAQDLAGAAPAFGPPLPAPIVQALIRAAFLAAGDLTRDPRMTALRETDSDAGEVDARFASPPVEGGADADLFRMLAPFRRLLL